MHIYGNITIVAVRRVHFGMLYFDPTSCQGAVHYSGFRVLLFSLVFWALCVRG